MGLTHKLPPSCSTNGGWPPLLDFQAFYALLLSLLLIIRLIVLLVKFINCYLLL